VSPLRRLTRRRFLKQGGRGAAGLALLGALGQRGAAAAAGRMNVVVIIVDSVRADHVGIYGGHRVKTPNLDRLARQSLRFTRARPEAFPTVPARRAIMSGKRAFPFRDWHPTPGLPKNPGWENIPKGRPIWTDLLRKAGWRTGYVTDNPWILNVAWDEFRSRFDRPIVVKGQTPYRGTPSGKVSARSLRRHLLPAQRHTSEAGRVREWLAANFGRKSEEDFLPARVFKAAMRWLDLEAGRGPFALVVDSFDPHEPWDPPASYARRQGGGSYHGVKPIQPFGAPGQRMRDAQLPRAALRPIQNLYEAELALVDKWLGRFLDKLDGLGLRDNTLVVLLSDHGVLLGERGWVGKHSSQIHREIYRVPYLIRDPRGRKAGRKSSYFASTHDVGPTVLSYLGVSVPDGMDGHDLSPLLAGRQPRKRSVFTARYGNYAAAGDGRWLLIAGVDGKRPRLYDTKRDPHERHNLARRKPRVVRRLWRRILIDAGGPLQKY
jgi:arylsulfatase A-like enzyme